jgi:hypothetical protein
VNGHKSGLHLEESGVCISKKMLSPSLDEMLRQPATGLRRKYILSDPG